MGVQSLALVEHQGFLEAGESGGQGGRLDAWDLVVGPHQGLAWDDVHQAVELFVFVPVDEVILDDRASFLQLIDQSGS